MFKFLSPSKDARRKLRKTPARHVSGSFNRIFSFNILFAAILVLAAGHVPARAEIGADAFLVAQRPISHPPGSTGLCSKYRWACAKTGRSTLHDEAAFGLAKLVNKQVNRETLQIDDQAQYGQEELWALPTSRGGDCEDLALLKKKRLVEAGIASEALLISTVLDRKMNGHAVLVFRRAGGDFVLDSLSDKIIPWNKTGYTFLKMQNPSSLGKWEAVLAGGIMQDHPTASR